MVFATVLSLSPKPSAKEAQCDLSEFCTGEAFGEVIRDYKPDPNTTWRSGKPNFAQVNKLFFESRSLEHEESSLEAIVGKMMRNWEVECHHIANIQQWKTMDISKFKASVNGGCICSAQKLAAIGPYNLFIGETEHYSSRAHSFASSEQVFTSAFPEGLTWECLEVFSGPPAVLFKWRQFGKYLGTFTDKHGQKYKGNGKMLELVGTCLLRVNEDLQIEALDLYYNPDHMTRSLTTMVDRSVESAGCDSCLTM
eukprot:TRINITY_DN85101_c0_g1_i1.p1 TRINITY_DN85101_c0_g1~~TRINITY_DN85101_c0_g1_i1.p1  ORF type:complete len:253 (+),score=48.87 TRINITY_DN85101_c0_g1_i1:67-825(+)